MTTIAIPANAERIDILTVLKPKLEPSRFAPGLQAYVSNYTCAGCGIDMGDVSTLRPTTCACGLTMQHAGFHMAIWRAEAVGA
jgi:hypothetical protein